MDMLFYGLKTPNLTFVWVDRPKLKVGDCHKGVYLVRVSTSTGYQYLQCIFSSVGYEHDANMGLGRLPKLRDLCMLCRGLQPAYTMLMACICYNTCK